MAPDTDSRCARSKAPPPTTRSSPLTVFASRSPRAPRTVRAPLTVPAWTRVGAPLTSTAPLTDSTLTSLIDPDTEIAPLTDSTLTSLIDPDTEIAPLTVSAVTGPVTSDTVMEEANDSMDTRLPAGTWTSMSEVVAWGLPATSTSTWIRCGGPLKASSARR